MGEGRILGPGDSHSDDVQNYFTKYHDAYRNSSSHATGADLPILIENLFLPPGSRVLDAASGTGHTALALAALGHEVVGMDVTEAMLLDARALAQNRHLKVEWVQGNVEHLPWDSRTFQAVTCRRAAHHFADPAQFIKESFRILKQGGKLGIADMTAPSQAIDALNIMERLRDQSHQRAMSANEWTMLVVSEGFDIEYLQVWPEFLDPHDWLYPVPWDSTDGQAAIHKLYTAPISEQLLHEGRFVKYRIVLAAKKP
jgi:ubiquinone/menaquinone biosynthesis C-methylase UbiE